MVAKWADDIIGSHVKGTSLADVSGLWGLVSEKVTVAVKAGGRTATMIERICADVGEISFNGGRTVSYQRSMFRRTRLLQNFSGPLGSNSLG
jgi:hypothetical protein